MSEQRYFNIAISLILLVLCIFSFQDNFRIHNNEVKLKDSLILDKEYWEPRLQHLDDLYNRHQYIKEHPFEAF